MSDRICIASKGKLQTRVSSQDLVSFVKTVEMDATEVTLILLGNTGLPLVLLLEIYITLLTGASLTLYPPVTTTLSEPSNLAPPVLKLPLVKKHAEMDGTLNMKMTRPTENLDTDLLTMLLLFKLN